MIRAWPWAAAGIVLTVLLAGAGGIATVPHPGFTARGNLVVTVEPEAAAARAGLRPGDRILRPTDLRAALLAKPGGRVPVRILRDGRELDLTVPALAPHSREETRRWIQSLVGISLCLLGLAVHRRRSDAVGRLFLGFTLALALPLHAPSPIRTPTAVAALTLLTDWAQVALGPLLVHFFFRFPESSPRMGPRTLRLLYAPAFLLGAAALLAPAGALPASLHQALPPVAGLYLTACLVLALMRFVLVFRRARRPADRLRLRAMLMGTAVALSPLVLGLIVPGRTGAEILRLGTVAPILLLALPLSYAYAIIRYQALDLEVSIRRRVVLAAATAVLLGAGTAGLAYLERHWHLAARSPWAAALGGAGLALALLLAHSRLRGILDRTVHGAGQDFEREVRTYENSLATLLHEKRVRGSVLENVCRLFGCELAGLYRFGAGYARLVLEQGRGAVRPPAGTVLLHESVRPILRGLRRVLEPEELVELVPEDVRGAVAQRLDDLGFAVLAPLTSGEETVGMLALGPPRGRPRYNRRERRALARIAVRAATALSTARAHADAVERERLARDMEVARGIQRRLLPDRPPLRLGVALDAVTLSCDAVGGDFYDFLELPDGRLGFAVGDVSGKGIGASLLMATVHSTVRTEAGDGASPRAVLRRVNLSLMERKEADKFVCLFYGVIDPDTGHLVYANAGVEPPILVRAAGGAELLTEGGLVLGVMAGAEFPEGEIRLEPGDRLLVFSDGVLESEVPGDVAEANRTEDDVLLPGYRRLIQAVLQGGGGPRESLRRLLRGCGFAPGSAPPDDATVLLVQRFG